MNIKKSIPKIGLYLGIITASITICGWILNFTYSLGEKKGKKYAYENIVEYLDELKTGIQITSVQCTPSELVPGETGTINLTIQNSTQYGCDLWVGASVFGSDNREFYNPLQDRTISLPPNGLTYATRVLTFPGDKKPGSYNVNINLWFGRRSDPSQSTILASATKPNGFKLITSRTNYNKANASDAKGRAAD